MDSTKQKIENVREVTVDTHGQARCVLFTIQVYKSCLTPYGRVSIHPRLTPWNLLRLKSEKVSRIIKGMAKRKGFLVGHWHEKSILCSFWSNNFKKSYLSFFQFFNNSSQATSSIHGDGVRVHK